MINAHYDDRYACLSGEEAEGHIGLDRTRAAGVTVQCPGNRLI